MSTLKSDGRFPENRPEEITRRVNEVRMDQFMQYYCPVRSFDPGKAPARAWKPDRLAALAQWLKGCLPRQDALSWAARVPFLFKRMKAKTA